MTFGDLNIGDIFTDSKGRKCTKNSSTTAMVADNSGVHVSYFQETFSDNDEVS